MMREFLLLDPDFEFKGERWIDADRPVGSIYLAETDFDSFVVTVQKNNFIFLKLQYQVEFLFQYIQALPLHLWKYA